MPEKSTRRAAPGKSPEKRPKQTKAPPTEEWVLTVNRDTGALIKIERMDAKTGKREEVSPEQFGQEFMKRAQNAFQGAQPNQSSANPQGTANPYMPWPWGS